MKTGVVLVLAVAMACAVGVVLKRKFDGCTP